MNLRQKRLLLLVFSLWLGLSCNNESRLPIGEKKMVAILKDVHIAEAAFQNLIGLTKDSVGEIYYQQIFDLHEVTKADFDTTMNRLRRDPKRMNEVYDQVILELDQIADSLLYNN